MRDLLELLFVLALFLLLFAWLGDVDATETVKKAWSIILDAVSQVGDAWREH